MAIENFDNLELHFNPKIDSNLEIKKRVLNAYEKNKLFFGCELTKKCMVHIIYKREEMDKVCGGIKSEPWLVGTTTQEGEIFIFSPTVFDKISSHPATNFDPIITHELAHVFTNEIIKTYRPVWLNEGLAGYIAGQCKSKQLRVIHDFEKLHSRKDWDTSPNYAQACQFTTFLIENFGKDALLQFLKDIPENDGTRASFSDFCKFFTDFFKADFNKVVQDWRKKSATQKQTE